MHLTIRPHAFILCLNAFDDSPSCMHLPWSHSSVLHCQGHGDSVLSILSRQAWKLHFQVQDFSSFAALQRDSVVSAFPFLHWRILSFVRRLFAQIWNLERVFFLEAMSFHSMLFLNKLEADRPQPLVRADRRSRVEPNRAAVRADRQSQPQSLMSRAFDYD